MNKWLMAAILACVPALAMGQSLRCDDKIISEGTPLAKVVALCGNPVQTDRKSVYYHPNESRGYRGNSLTADIEVQVEVWIYNFGPDRLMQRIRFEDGRVVRIESIGYGY